MNSGKQELEAITVRRAKVADSDKVRYRVYTSPNEFIAVIAESALMAVKVSGVKVPHKIMRDLPTDGVAIEAKKMAEVERVPEKVAFALGTDPKPAQRMTDLGELSDRSHLPFVPVGLADLRTRSGNRARILPPEMVNQIIEEHKAQTAPVEMAPQPVAAVVEEHETVLIPEPELSPAERITLMASEMFPADASPEAGSNPEDGLSPQEVDKLLNG